MRYYKMTNAPRQRFSIILPEEEITMEVRWIPAARFWVASIKIGNKIDHELNGVRIVSSLPIFKQYGYPEIVFLTHGNEIKRELDQAVLVVLSQENLKQGSTLEYVNPGQIHAND